MIEENNVIDNHHLKDIHDLWIDISEPADEDPMHKANPVEILLCILFQSYEMPIKMSKKGGGIKKRSFDEGVSDLKKQGKSEESARKIMGSIKKKQEGGKATTKKKKKDSSK